MGDDSARNRIKFLCSCGGRILPRPSDGQLKYIGGDNRVFAVPRSVSFSGLKKRLTGAFDADLEIKYSLMLEDLDTLVSVKTDEDVRHMIDEYDRQDGSTGGGGSPRFRVFLFQIKATSSTAAGRGTGGLHPNIASLERRYIDAINGVRFPARKCSPSPGSSPTSTTTAESAALEFPSVINVSRLRHPMHKAHSSPNLCGMGTQAVAGPLGNINHHQQHPWIPRPRQCSCGAVGVWRTVSPPPAMYENETSPVDSPRCARRRRNLEPSTFNGSRRESRRGLHGSHSYRQDDLCSYCFSRRLL